MFHLSEWFTFGNVSPLGGSKEYAVIACLNCRIYVQHTHAHQHTAYSASTNELNEVVWFETALKIQFGIRCNPGLGPVNAPRAPFGAMDVGIFLAFWWRRLSLKVRNSECFKTKNWETNPCQCLATRKAGASYKWTRCWTPPSSAFMQIWLVVVWLQFRYVDTYVSLMHGALTSKLEPTFDLKFRPIRSDIR